MEYLTKLILMLYVDGYTMKIETNIFFTRSVDFYLTGGDLNFMNMFEIDKQKRLLCALTGHKKLIIYQVYIYQRQMHKNKS